MRPTAPALFALSLLAGTASATDLHVPGDHPTIQAAVDAAVSGDEVLVAPGVHAGPVQLEAGVRLIGSGWKTCVIDAQEKGSVLKLSGDSVEEIVVRGFTIRNAKPSANLLVAGGIVVLGGSGAMNLTIRDNRFEDCGIGFLPSGGVGGLLEVRGNQFVGLTSYALSVPDKVPAEIRNNTIVHCGSTAISSGSNSTSPVTIENNVLAYNGGYGIQGNAAANKKVRYNTLYANTKGPFFELLGAGTSWNPTPNLHQDPKLQDHLASDLHLTSTSPCIDAGKPGEQDPDGSPIDIGALPYDAGYVPPTAKTHGQGCGGLAMTHDGEPWLGSVGRFSIGVAGAPPGAPLLLLVGLSNTSWSGVPLPAPIPNAPGCSLLVAPLFLLAAPPAPATGTLAFPTPLSDDPSVVGLPIHLQWVASAPGANPAGIVFSDALEFAHGD